MDKRSPVNEAKTADGRNGQEMSQNIISQTNQRFQNRPGGPEPESSSLEMSTAQPPRPKRSYRAANQRRYLTPSSQSSSDEDDDDSSDSNNDDASEDAFPGATPIPGPRTANTSNYASIVVPLQEEMTEATGITCQSSTPTIQAKVVDPDVEENRVRQELLKELEANTPTATVVQNEVGLARNSQKKKLALLACLLLAVVVIIIVLAAVLAGKNKKSNTATKANLASTTAPSTTPSVTPTVSLFPTGMPSTTPSSMPTIFWTQIGESQVLRQSLEGLAENDQFGRSLALSNNGEIVAIGAIQHDFGGLSNSGQVQVFRLDKQQQDYVPLGQAIGGEASGDIMGSSVALSRNGTILACGAIRSDPNGIESAGRIRVYSLLTNNDEDENNIAGRWTPLGSPIDGPVEDVVYGVSLSLSDNGLVLAIGTGVGEARVFEWNGERWEQIGSSLSGDETFGHTFVDLSGDGRILAEGSFGGNDRRVRVHKYLDNVWRQVGRDILAHRRGDWLGRPISLSSDGTILAIGEPLRDTTITKEDGSITTLQDSGRVRVYRLENSIDWVQIGQV